MMPLSRINQSRQVFDRCCGLSVSRSPHVAQSLLDRLSRRPHLREGRHSSRPGSEHPHGGVGGHQRLQTHPDGGVRLQRSMVRFVNKSIPVLVPIPTFNLILIYPSPDTHPRPRHTDSRYPSASACAPHVRRLQVSSCAQVIIQCSCRQPTHH